MKRTTSIQLAFSFVGVFLGAGFVSGQELWQFFACFGPSGIFGFLLSASLCFLVNFALLHLSWKIRCADIGELVLPGDHPFFCTVIDVLQCLLLFGIVVIMVAGASALLHNLTGLAPAICGALFVLIVLPAAMFDLKGMVTAFSVLVPFTGITAVIMGVTILFRQDFQLLPAVGSTSALLPTWWISGVTYATYNLFGTIGVLVPFAALVPDRKTITRGVGLGTAFLVILTCCILASMIAIPACGSSELPTAALAAQLHPLLGLSYNLLMGLGMFSSALASIIALIKQASFHWPVLQIHKKGFLLLFLVLAYVLSLAGFGNLISIIYPIFGYISIPFLFMLVRNWWKSRKTTPAN